MGSKISNFAVGLFESVIDLLLPFIRPLIVELLRKVIFAELKAADEVAYKNVLVSAYGPIDTVVEDAVKKTETKIDDVMVAAFKQAFEEEAAESGIQLVNLDED